MPVLLAALSSAACIDRTRINDACEWTRDAAFPLDLTTADGRRHLIADAQLAEALAVRYADTEHKRRFGYGGHGRLIEHGEVLRRCFDAVTARIEHDHGATAAQIDAARAQRNPAFDAPVMLTFAAFYAGAAAVLAARIRRRFYDQHRLAGGAIALAASAAASTLGVQLGAVWGAIWETVRIGDDHFGTFRAARSPWGSHLGALFAAGVAAFWLAFVLAAPAARRHLSPSRSD